MLTQLALRRGMDLNVNMLGRWAVWPTMVALGLAMVSETWVSEALLYVGLAMTLAATALYLQDGLAGLAQKAQALLEHRLYSLGSRLRRKDTPWTHSPTSARSPTRS